MNTITTFMSSIIFLVLFSIAIIGFTIGFADDNNAAVSVSDELSDYRVETKDNLDTFNDEADTSYKSILKSTVEPGSDVFQSSAPLTITFGNLIKIAKNMINLPRKYIFGSSGEGSSGKFNIFFDVFIWFLVILLALLGYKALRGNV